MRRISSKKSMAADLKAIIADVEELLKATAAEQGEQIRALKTRLEGSLETARSWVVEMEQAAEEKAKEAAKATDVYVHENPWQAIALAAGIGFIFGTQARRK